MKKGEEYPRDLFQIRLLVQEKLRKVLPEHVENWTHVSGGCETGSSWRRSMDAYDGLGFHPKMIPHGRTAEVDLSVEMFGMRWNLPVAIAPMSAAVNGVCDDAFLNLAQGAKRAGIPVGIGYPNGSEIHVRMRETGAQVFRMIKPLRDRGKLRETLEGTEQDGCFAAGIDIDSMAGLKPRGDRCLYEDMCDPLTMGEIKELRRGIKIPFIVKGIMSVEDALSALDIGSDAIVVSTHAGASLDYSPSPLEVLPSIARAVDKRMRIFVDSGIRRGSDIIKAIALGADGVLIGRLALWGLVLGGSEGLLWILKLMAEEMRRILVLIGVNQLSELNMRCLFPLNEIGERILSRL